jgi:DNA-binding transcriptional LysR family regulator
MNARTQYNIDAADLEVVLALVRAGTLATASERLGIDASTVFRSLQRIERGLGQPLFERSRAGYAATELAQSLATHAERIETVLEESRSAAQLLPGQVSGTVRITTTDSVLHGLVAPALKGLVAEHPLISFELLAGNELANLSRRDADIAVRATRRPPQHLIGKHVGPIRVALFASRKGRIKSLVDVEAGVAAWIAVDDALPDHPSVVWRKRRHPKVVPTYRVNSILTVMEMVALGLGVGMLPMFLAEGRGDLRMLTPIIDEAQTDLWILAHPESRHLRRVSAVYAFLAKAMSLQ